MPFLSESTIEGPARRVGTITSELAIAPLRFLGPLTDPLRNSVANDLRKSLGVTAPTGPPSIKPETSFLDPAGIAPKIHSEVGPMMIGGISSLFLQMLHPLVMAGVADHSIYKEDPTGRLQRTAQYVGVTTYGTVDEANAMFEIIKKVHKRVTGITPDGRGYSARDPDLITWVHVTEMASFLHAAQRFGRNSITPADCDAYWKETAPIALGLGAQWVPHTVDEANAYFQRMKPELYADSQAFEARDFLIRGTATRPEERFFYGVIIGASIGLLPRWARSMLHFTKLPFVDSMLIAPSARTLCAALRWISQAPWPQAIDPSGQLVGPHIAAP